jgi:hypothetical protein
MVPLLQFFFFAIFFFLSLSPIFSFSCREAPTQFSISPTKSLRSKMGNFPPPHQLSPILLFSPEMRYRPVLSLSFFFLFLFFIVFQFFHSFCLSAFFFFFYVCFSLSKSLSLFLIRLSPCFLLSDTIFLSIYRLPSLAFLFLSLSLYLFVSFHFFSF